MQKILKKAFIFIFILGTLTTSTVNATSCSNDGHSDKFSIVTTIFPQYDWVKQILGDKIDDVELTLLLDNGVDLHSYQPTAADIVTVSTCDMFIYVGGHSDEWVEDVLKQATNVDMTRVNLMDVLGDAVKEEEIVGGMEHEEEGEHGHVHEDDEHVWLSLLNAKTICEEIANKLNVIDPVNAETYSANLAFYCEQLTSLHDEYKQAVEEATVKTLLFGDRFSFRYLVDDYGIEYYAAFSGCSAESEASFETIAFLAEKVDELGLGAVVKLEGSEGKLAQTIVNTTTAKNAKILTMDSMQSVTAKDVADGVTYLSVMQKNLTVLKEALR